MVVHNLTKAVDKCLHNLLLMGVVSLSIFRGNFVMAKVRLGLISVHCSKLRGICFFRGFYGKINRGQVICPLYRSCLLFGGSAIRRFTVNVDVKRNNKKEGSK